MKKNFFLAPVCMMLIVCTNAQTTISKSTTILKKVDTTKNISTLTNSNQTPELIYSTIKKQLPGKWVGRLFSTNDPTADDIYYCLQFNTDGTLQQFSKDGALFAKGTYRLYNDQIEFALKNITSSNSLKSTINISTYTMKGYLQNKPNLEWKLTKQMN